MKISNSISPDLQSGNKYYSICITKNRYKRIINPAIQFIRIANLNGQNVFAQSCFDIIF